VFRVTRKYCLSSREKLIGSDKTHDVVRDRVLDGKEPTRT